MSLVAGNVSSPPTARILWVPPDVPVASLCTAVLTGWVASARGESVCPRPIHQRSYPLPVRLRPCRTCRRQGRARPSSARPPDSRRRLRRLAGPSGSLLVRLCGRGRQLSMRCWPPLLLLAPARRLPAARSARRLPAARSARRLPAARSSRRLACCSRFARRFACGCSLRSRAHLLVLLTASPASPAPHFCTGARSHSKCRIPLACDCSSIWYLFLSIDLVFFAFTLRVSSRRAKTASSDALRS
jgi:hypothetical protein